MLTNISTSQTHSWNSNLPINKFSLEKAEEVLILDLKNKALREWKSQLQTMNNKKVGAPFKYSRSFILLAVVLLYLKHLSYRRLVAELYILTGIRISKSQLYDRIMKLSLSINIDGFLNEKLMEIAVDATGFKPTEKGNWRIINHENGEVKRDGYIKFMGAVDLKTLSIVSGFIGDAQTADITLFEPLFEEIRNRTKVLYGDGSFDTFKVYRKCIEAGIIPVIRPDKNAIVRYNKDGLPRDLRSYYVDFIKKNGYHEWSRRFNFGKRWLVEIVYSKFKRLFGEIIKSKKEENIRQEFTLKIWIYNALTALQHGFRQLDYFFRFIFYEYFILEK